MRIIVPVVSLRCFYSLITVLSHIVTPFKSLSLKKCRDVAAFVTVGRAIASSEFVNCGCCDDRMGMQAPKFSRTVHNGDIGVRKRLCKYFKLLCGSDTRCCRIEIIILLKRFACLFSCRWYKLAVRCFVLKMASTASKNFLTNCFPLSVALWVGIL